MKKHKIFRSVFASTITICIVVISLLLLFISCSRQPQDLIRVACIGDSITYGTMVPNRNVNAYPAQLQQLLGSQYQVKNFGVNGCAMLKTADLPYWRHEYFKASSEFQPHIVIIMLGTNDSKQGNWTGINNYIADYREMVAHYRNLLTQPEVYVMTPPSAFVLKDSIVLDFNMQMEVIGEIAEHIGIMAVEDGLTVIDIYGTTAGHPEYFPVDGIHTNEEGAKKIAQTVYEVLTQGQ